MIFSFNGETGCTKGSRSSFRVKVFMMLWSLSSVPEKMTQELNPNRLSSKDKGDFPTELKLHRIDSASGAQAPQTRFSLRSLSSRY